MKTHLEYTTLAGLWAEYAFLRWGHSGYSTTAVRLFLGRGEPRIIV